MILRHVPPPLWALALLTLGYCLSLAPGLRDLPILSTRSAGLIVTGVSLAILLMAILQFRFTNTQLLPASKENNALVTSGVFALTRNPMYLAMTLFCVGGALWFGRLPMFAAPAAMFGVANWAFIPFEEEKMRRQFGEKFDAYCARVRRWL